MLRWFAEEGWVTVLAILTLILVVFTFVGHIRQNRRIKVLELRFHGIMERLTATYTKIDTVDRRITGKLEGGNEDATKLKKAMKKIKPEDYDDK